MATPTTVCSTPDATGVQKGRQTKTQHAFREEDGFRNSPGRGKKTANISEGDSNTNNKAAWKTAAKIFSGPPGRDRESIAAGRHDRGTTVQRPDGKISSAINKFKGVVKSQQDKTAASGPRTRPTVAPRQAKSIRDGREGPCFAWSEGTTKRKETNLSQNRIAMLARPYRGALDTERCSRCSREAVWTACDVFWTFDPKWFAWSTGLTNTAPSKDGQPEHPKEITRQGYVQALSFAPTVDRLRMLRRSGLEQRFRKSAQPVDLKEWLTMIWPAATHRDMLMMMRWAKLREAWSIVHGREFRSTDAEMNRVFDLLSESADCEVPLGEFVRAQLMTVQECQKLFRKLDLHHRVNKENDKSTLQNHFKTTYVNLETQRRMKAEEEALISNVSNWMGMGIGEKKQS